MLSVSALIAARPDKCTSKCTVNMFKDVSGTILTSFQTGAKKFGGKCWQTHPKRIISVYTVYPLYAQLVISTFHVSVSYRTSI